MTGAPLKRFAPYERRFWLLNPSSPNPPCPPMSSARSRGFPWWSAPTRWISWSLKERYQKQRRSKPLVMTAHTLKRLQRTAEILRKSSKPWQSKVGFRLKLGRLSIAKSPSALTRRCARAVRRGGGARHRGAMIHAASCIHWPVGRVLVRISDKLLDHMHQERLAKQWKNVRFNERQKERDRIKQVRQTFVETNSASLSGCLICCFRNKTF